MGTPGLRTTENSKLTSELEGAAQRPLGVSIDVDPNKFQTLIGGVSGVVFAPSVLIGLGGSGVECLRRAKQKLLARVGNVPTIAFIYIDADSGSFVERPGLAPVEQSEKCFIGGDRIWPLVDFPRDNAWILDQIPGGLSRDQYEKVGKGDGCGQLRAVGRVAALTSILDIQHTIEGAIGQVQRLAARLASRVRTPDATSAVGADVTVYIVGSLAGGTGSGVFLDVTLLARQLTGARAKIIGLFILPEAFDEKAAGDEEQRKVMRANTYAALKEIQALLDPHSDLSLECQVDAAGRKLELQAGASLFDLCYLIDFKNEFGQRLSKTEDVYELVSRFLLHENGTPFGSRARSVARNLNTLKGVAVCPKTRLPRRFSTFSTSSLRYPVDRIVRYCTWSTFHELLDEVLLKVPTAIQVRNQEVQSFLDSNELNELGATDQVQNRLLKDPQTNEILSSTQEGVGETFGQKLKANEFTRKIQQKLTSFQENSLPGTQKLVEDNSSFYLGRRTEAGGRPVEQMMDKFLASSLRQYGARGCEGILETLKSRLETMKGQMLQENNTWRTSKRNSLQSQFNGALEGLARVSTIGAMLTKKDLRHKQTAIEAFNAIVDGDNHALAKTGAVRVFEDALGLLHSRSASLTRFITEVNLLGRRLQDAGNGLVTEEKREITGFVPEMDVTGPGYSQKYFQEHKVDSNVPLNEGMQASGLGDNYLLRLLEMNQQALISEFGNRIRDLYLPALQATSVVEFVASNVKQEKVLAAKLDQLFEMCQPFWQTRAPQAGMKYENCTMLGCMPQTGSTGDGPQYPPEVDEWKKQHVDTSRVGAGASPEILPTTIPYEIELVRYTHGARGFYLADGKEWKEKYEKVKSQQAFPLHLHVSLESVPDLLPDDAIEAKKAFALGLALGFVAKRGEHYYVNVEAEGSKVPDGRKFKVGYDTEWQTVFGPRESRSLPSPPVIGPITFSFKSTKPLQSLRVGQGRNRACSSLARDLPNVNLILEAAGEYREAVGTDKFKKQLAEYLQFLENCDVPAQVRDQIREEIRLIKDYQSSME
jgi:Tubulin like